MHYETISLESLCIVISMIIFVACFLQTTMKRKKNRIFTHCTIFNALALFGDLLGALVDGNVHLTHLNILFNFLSFFLSFQLLCCFAFYIIAVINEIKPKKYTLAIINGWLVEFIEIFIIISTITGKLFYINNGVYTQGPLYNFAFILYLICTFYNLFVVLFYSKDLGTRNFIMAISYVFIIMISFILKFIFKDISFTYVASTLLLLVIYITIQTQNEREFISKENELFNESHKDELTKLMNRRAYNNFIDCIPNTHIGVIFSDLNGLKYTNDNFGHSEGDKLLKKYTKILNSTFRKDNIFRVSGDEFVIIILDIDNETFKKRCKQFKKNNKIDKLPVASFGKAYGLSNDVNKLVEEAESKMYEDKKTFHKKYPKFNRVNLLIFN